MKMRKNHFRNKPFLKNKEIEKYVNEIEYEEDEDNSYMKPEKKSKQKECLCKAMSLLEFCESFNMKEMNPYMKKMVKTVENMKDGEKLTFITGRNGIHIYDKTKEEVTEMIKNKYNGHSLIIFDEAGGIDEK